MSRLILVELIFFTAIISHLHANADGTTCHAGVPGLILGSCPGSYSSVFERRRAKALCLIFPRRMSFSVTLFDYREYPYTPSCECRWDYILIYSSQVRVLPIRLNRIVAQLVEQ